MFFRCQSDKSNTECFSWNDQAPFRSEGDQEVKKC